jgi:hypothetical protein
MPSAAGRKTVPQNPMSAWLVGFTRRSGLGSGQLDSLPCNLKKSLKGRPCARGIRALGDSGGIPERNGVTRKFQELGF